MFSQLSNIIIKEWREISRDRRSMLTLLMISFGMPLYLYFIISMIASSAERETDINALLVGGEMAPNMVQFLEEQNITFKTHSTLEEAQEALEAKEVILVIEKEFRANYLNSLPAPVSLYVNRKDNTADGNAGDMKRLIEAYADTVEQARLIARGISPSRTVAINVERYDLTAAGGISNQLAGMILMMLIIASISGTISATADVIAGERERQTLQPLLTQPVSPGTLIVGKWLSLCILGVLFCISAFFISGFTISRAPLEKIGATFYLDIQTIMIGSLSICVLAFFMTSVQTLLATIAKSYREAMTYLPMVMIVPTAVTFVPLFLDVGYDGLMSFLPVFNQTFVLKELLLEGQVPLLQYFGGMATTMAASLVMIAIAMRRFGSEHMLD